MPVFFTGRRPKYIGTYNLNDKVWRDIFKATVKEVEKLIIEGESTFYTGGALGFDVVAFYAVEKLKKKYDGLNNILCIPTINHYSRWNDIDINRFFKMKKSADKIVNVYEIKEYYSYSYGGKLNRRNDYMADNSNICISLWEGNKLGGTYNAIKYIKNIGFRHIQ